MDRILTGKILKLYRDGMSLRAIGKTLNISHESVRAVIPKEEMRWKRIDEQMKKEIISVYKRTGSYQETANELKIPLRQIVYRVVTKAAK